MKSNFLHQQIRSRLFGFQSSIHLHKNPLPSTTQESKYHKPCKTNPKHKFPCKANTPHNTGGRFQNEKTGF